MKFNHTDTGNSEAETISQICEKYCITAEEFEAFGLSSEEFLEYVNLTLPELLAADKL